MEYVSQYAYEYNVPETVILAVIKVESDFNAGAVSSVGAKGLMQMMPDTFEWLRSEEHLDERLHEDDLFEPEISIKYGTYYLSYLHKKFDRNWDTALAAYNGGEGNVAKWLKNPEYSDGNGNLTYIPFKETRNYVQKVNKAIDTYKNLYYQNQKEVVENEN
jgi:soluble lytic murein transglycosylase